MAGAIAGLASNVSEVVMHGFVVAADVNRKSNLALSNVFGALVQVPYVILPAILLLAAPFAALA